MTATEREDIARTLAERLQTEPGDRLARLALADMLEEDGFPQAAAVQRLLDDARCGGPDDSDEDGQIDVTVEWDQELCAYTAQVRWETDSDEGYVIADEWAALAAAPLRRQCEWVPWWPR